MKIIITALFIAVINSAAAAQNKVVPIIDMKMGGLLGGVQNGRYLDAQTTVEQLEAEQNYTLFLFNGKSESLRLKKPANRMDVCPDFFSLDQESDYSEEFFQKGGVALGTGFTWEPQPRELKSIALNNAAYRKIIADYLRTQGIAKPLVQLKQAVRVDLEGDGQEEVLLAATRTVSYEQRKENARYDEYSVVLMRKIINNRPRTVVIAGEIYPRNSMSYDGNVFNISSILDLNGDGKLEIVVHSEYYEGGAARVVQIIGNKPEAVKLLSVDCGI